MDNAITQRVAMMSSASSKDLVLKFTSLMSSHCQVFQSSLVLEFEKCIAVLQEENETLRKQLLVGTRVAGFDCRSVSHPCGRSGSNVASDTSYQETVGDIDEPGRRHSKPAGHGVPRIVDDPPANPGAAVDTILTDIGAVADAIPVVSFAQVSSNHKHLHDFDCRSVSQPGGTNGSKSASNTTYQETVGDIDEPGRRHSKPAGHGVPGVADDPPANPGAGHDNILAESKTVADAIPDAHAPHPSHNRKHLHYLGHAGKKKTQHRRPPPMEDQYHHPMNGATRHGVFPLPHSDHNWFERIVFNKHFELLSAVIILLNTLIMALHMQYLGLDAGHDLGWRRYSQPAAQSWPWMEDFNRAARFFFNFLFCMELILRIAAAGKGACGQAWIWFDTVVVSLSMMDLVLPSGSIPVNPGMMRVIRLVRLVRLLKLLKTVNAFDSLFLLLKAVKASAHAAVWSFLILVTVQLVVGLLLCQILGEYINDESNPRESREKVFKYFGTFSRSMLTMFELTLGNWVVCCRMLVENVNEWFMLALIAYRCFFCFAVLKVISAVFITETNRVLEHDDELAVMKKTRDKEVFTRKVHSLVQNLDLNREGMIDWDAFDYLAQDAELARLLVPLGFEIHDLEKVFWLLQDGNGHVKMEEFLHKVGRLRGNAKEIDSQTLIKVAHRIDETVHTIFHKQGLMEEDVDANAIEDKACIV